MRSFREFDFKANEINVISPYLSPHESLHIFASHVSFSVESWHILRKWTGRKEMAEERCFPIFLGFSLLNSISHVNKLKKNSLGKVFLPPDGKW